MTRPLPFLRKPMDRQVEVTAVTILKRGNSKFWYAQFQMGGQTFVRSTRTTDRRAAKEVEARFRTEIHARTFLGHKQAITLGEALDRFIDSKRQTPNHRNLVIHRKALLRVLRRESPLSSLGIDDIEQFRERRIAEGCAPQTIQHSINLVRGALKHASRLGYDAPNLAFIAEKITKRRVRYLSWDEEAKLLTELDPAREGRGLSRVQDRSADMIAALQDCYDLIVVLLDTGARYSEVANIEWQQIELATKTIRLWRTKVQNESVLFMTDRVHEILSRRERSRRGRFVFANKNGGSRGYSAQAIRKAFNRAGLSDCTIHTLRHTHATRLIQNGLNLYEVRSVLGHSDIKTTMRYAHLEQASVTMKARDMINRLSQPAPIALPAPSADQPETQPDQLSMP